jgi:serine/threonine-protein kinase
MAAGGAPVSADVGSLGPGAVVCGKYEVVRAIGRGASGSVFEARNLLIGKSVAIKVLPRQGGTMAARREALGASIRSPYVIDIYDILEDTDRDLLVIVMELLEGATLQRLADVGKRFDEDEIVTVLSQVLSGIARAHERGIVHGDLKPANVFAVHRTDDERIVLLDFGIASLQASVSADLSGIIGGTPLWMNPEAFEGGIRTWRADTWAIGLLAFWMTTGRSYWESKSATGLVVEILRGPTLAPSRLADVPHWLDAFFAATVTTDDHERRAASALVSMLPQTSQVRVPRMGVRASTTETAAFFASGGRGAEADALAATQAFAPNEPGGSPDLLRDLLGTRARTPPADGDSVRTHLPAILPDSMLPSAGGIANFLDAIFEGAQRTERVLRLERPRLDFAKAYEFFLVALASARTAALGTQTFVGYTRSLEELLAPLDRLALKVVIVLVDTTELGIGVRARIADLFRTYKAALIPAYVGDIATLRREAAAEWLRGRWYAHRPVTNPFEPRVFDRTLIQGQGAIVNRFVEALGGGPAAYGVYGPPGSGKTSLVKRVEAELRQETEFRWIECGMLPERDRARELLRRAANAFGVPFEEVGGRPVEAFTAGVAHAKQSGRRLVIVLDDADALVDPAYVSASDDDQRFLLELRQQVAYLLEGNGVSVVFVGLRSFVLGREQIAGHPNPLRRFFHPVRVPALQREELRRLCGVGRQVDLLFDDEAVERIESWSAGNVYVAQALCSQVLAGCTAGRTVQIDARGVDAAAAELVASREVFESRLIPWLTEAERHVLSTVPRVAFRRPLDLVPMLPGISDAAIGNALDCLVQMGVLERPMGKTRVAGRLLEAWVKMHMSPPAGAVQHTRERTLRAVTLGVCSTAVLYGVGATVLGAGEQSAVVRDGSCTTTVLLPSRVVLHEPRTITVSRSCLTDGASPHADAGIDLRPVLPTIAVFARDGGPAVGNYAHPTPSDHEVFQDSVDLIVKGPQAASYTVRLSADGQIASVAVGRDWLGGLPALLRGLVVASGALPAVIGVILTFYADVRRLIEQWLSKKQTA